MANEAEPISLFEPPICELHCSVCEGLDHHWLPACDEETGEPLMVCKHCEATRPMRNDGELYT